MRKLIGAMLAVTALSPIAAQAQAIRGDVGVEAQREDRVDDGPRPSRRDDRTSEQRRDRGPADDRPDRGGSDRDIRPDAPPNRQWSGRPDAGRPDASRGPDRTDGRDPRYGTRDGGQFAGRPGRDPRRPGIRNDRDDWTHSRLDRRDDRWTQSRFEDRSAWNRGWRGDDRYDWNRYREANRGAYRLPRYYAPNGWGGGYRRFGIGVGLQRALWGQNYWISDPYAYRLPEAYGPYRWVRYYGDALLVDLRSGLVVDAVYGIFW
jgi:hypothetical protein